MSMPALLKPILPLALTLAAAGSAALSAQEPAPAAPAPAERSDPFLWHVEGKGVEAYLFGTVHLPDERVLALAPEVKTAFDAADAFYAEIEATDASRAAVMGHALLPAGQRLPDLIGPELWGRITARLKAKGVNSMQIASFGGLEPWAISALLPTLDYLDEQQKGIKSLDEALYAAAETAKKKARGLETVDEQVAVFTAFDRAEQIQLLRESVEQLEKDDASGESTIEKTVQAWLSGNEARLLDILELSFAVDPALRMRAEDGLLWERNLRFAKRIDAALTERPDEVAFIAIGALHMPDPREQEAEADRAATAQPADAKAADGEADAAEIIRRAGLVTLLRERGYEVTRVEALEPVGAGK